MRLTEQAKFLARLGPTALSESDNWSPSNHWTSSDKCGCAMVEVSRVIRLKKAASVARDWYVFTIAMRRGLYVRWYSSFWLGLSKAQSW